MSQRIFHSPSVFNYYSPGFRVAGTALNAPEFQIYTTATATIRANFAGRLVNGAFGSNVEKAISAYQSVNSLTSTGRMDADTWTALNRDTAPARIRAPWRCARLGGHLPRTRHRVLHQVIPITQLKSS